jgi:hypothetical protein
MSNNNNQQQPERCRFATDNIVRKLDKQIEQGDVAYLIDLLTNSREHLLSKTQDSSMIDCELQEYKEYFADLDTIRAVIAFLRDLNRNCPEHLKPERRLQWE